MPAPPRRRILVLAILGLAGSLLPIRRAECKPSSWTGYARNAQHSALASVRTQPLARIRWQTPVDLAPQYSGEDLFIHYGSPLVTQQNTVVVPVKTGATGGFRVEGHRGRDGLLLWTLASDYVLPPHDWTPSFSPALSQAGRLWVPAGGGTVYRRTNANSKSAPATRLAFYGIDRYLADPATYQAQVMINTPITADRHGNVFFGFQVGGATQAALASGIARISARGAGSWMSAAQIAADSSITKLAHNSAPALSNDEKTLYVAVNDGGGFGAAAGYLVALDSDTLAPLARVRLKDPTSGLDADVHDDATSSPTIGPDGDVYFGVLETPFLSNHARGWLLHFDPALVVKGPPGAFGWDDTPSIVPSTMVASYGGSSSDLLMTKYNNYVEGGGDGVNRIAVLDPNDQMVDPISGATVMREVLTVAGPTPDEEFLPAHPGAVREWCINTAAVDPRTRSVLANNEDGVLYRWDMTSGSLSESITLTSGIGEAYTPTVVGPDGTVYAINNATLFAVGR
ncbi:MAG TPA: hypothetical protein VEI94_13240 [Candidatus Bathyarchaeia archaeon]|nr:hypothetical protein [Candidatus Bathyarchaeia archaeon]